MRPWRSPPPYDANDKDADLPIPYVNDVGWPEWMTEAYDFFMEKDLGDDFEVLIAWWAGLERLYDFETSVSAARTITGY